MVISNLQNDTAGLPSPPRRVRRRPGRGKLSNFWDIFLVPFTVIGICVLVYVLNGTIGYFFGKLVPGRITSMSYDPTPAAHYSYRVNGVTYTGSDKINLAENPEMHEGSQVQIHVSPTLPGLDPELMRPGLIQGGVMGLWLFVVVWNGFVIAAWWKGLIRPSIDRSLIVSGDACGGVITDKTEEKDKLGDSINYVVRYQFDAGNGYRYRTAGPVTGRMILEKTQWDTVRPGQSVIVFFNPNNPKSSICYTCADWQIVDNVV